MATTTTVTNGGGGQSEGGEAEGIKLGLAPVHLILLQIHFAFIAAATEVDKG